MSLARAPLPPASPGPTPGALPLSAEQSTLLSQLTEQLDGARLWWLSGYAAGLAQSRLPLSAAVAAAVDAPPAAVDVGRLTVLYGSQTGNARRVAEELAQRIEAEGLPVRLVRADAYATRELKDERYLAIVISTQGDGDAPDDAHGFVEFLLGKRAPQLPQLHFAVFGLGDSSYPQFCEIGRKLDARLAELGATRWLPRVDADLDVDSVAKPWLAQVQQQSAEALKPRPALATVTPLRPQATQISEAWTRSKPFQAELLTNQRITGRGSDRDVRHLEIDLHGSGLDYEPGDALGVWAQNPPALVDAVLIELGLDGDTAVRQGDDSLPLQEWLRSRRELTKLTRPFVAQHAAHAGSEALNRLLAPDQSAGLTALLAESQVIDLLQAYPGEWTAEDLIAALRPLQPRLYSIASSRKAVGDEAHLTVAHVEYSRDGQPRWGTGSHFLAATEEGARLPVFIERNERFRVPNDTARDIIMIGPGTGVAPFRGFVQERAAVGASGRNWLLFGNPHARSDFLYQVEWQDALKRGTLHKLSLAFSRDQAQKVYVQHKLREHGRELYAWLESGAHLYVCGDATRMAKDVHAALIGIIAEHGGKSAEDAAEQLSQLQTQGRYARDVY